MKTTKTQVFTIALIIIGAIVSSCSNSKPAITIQVNGLTEPIDATIITERNVRTPITIDSTGRAYYFIKGEAPQYITLAVDYRSRIFWVNPSTAITVSFENGKFEDDVVISGKGANENNYLNSGKLKELEREDAALEEALFFKKADSLYSANLTTLEEAALSKDFTEMEKVRLKYHTYGFLPSYPYQHTRATNNQDFEPSEKYWDKVKELAVWDGSLLKFNEYYSFIYSSIIYLARREYPELNRTDGIIKYIDNYVNDASIAEEIVFANISLNVGNQGTAIFEKHKEKFYHYVKRDEYIRKIEEACSRWKAVEAGNPSPDFDAADIEGKKYTLADYRGKFVYIDVWATWCGPCRMEIPYLKELEKRMEGTDVVFLSLSCDEDKEAWEKMVKEDGMSGNQLHIGDKSSFMTNFIIKGIPRFILLDKEGKIINANMTRPSHPNTEKVLRSL